MVALKLDDTVRQVILQFSFSNPDVVPPSAKRLNPETTKEHVERKSHSNGIMVIEPTEKCSLVEFLGELETAGYEMAAAFCQERINVGDRFRKTYYMVCFLFVRREFVELSDEFNELRNTIRAELQSICESAMWRIRAFSNPFYKNGYKEGEEVPGLRAVSINLEVRQPLFHPNGQPVAVWQKDENGQRVGDAPLPLKPNYYLRIVGDTVKLMTV